MTLENLITASRPYLTESGLETSMLFQYGFDMPCFAAFTLLDRPAARPVLEAYYDRHIALARRAGTGFVIDTMTWRANDGWGDALGLDAAGLAEVNRRSAAFAIDIAHRHRATGVPVLVSGTIGPAGDGYVAGEPMSAGQARDLHAPQIETLVGAGVDLVTALTLTNVAEAIGIASAAEAAGIPCVISLTLETDGRLPTGQPLAKAIADLDAATGGSALFVMINCAHPDHFMGIFAEGGDWIRRIGGVRANASRLSHAELDASETLDYGDPQELGEQHRSLAGLLPNLRVIGGCCGTDDRHVACIAANIMAVAAA